MAFTKLPRSLLAYLLGYSVLLIPLLGLLSHAPNPTRGGLCAALLLLSAVFATWKVELTVHEGKMTLGFAIACLALLLQGPQVTVACAVVAALISTTARHQPGSWRVHCVRMPFFKYWFNAVNCATASGVGALLFVVVRERLAGESIAVLVGLTVFTTVYFALNTLGTALAIALHQGLRPFPVWKENFLWTAPGFFASASAAGAILLLFSYLHAWSLLFVAPLYVIYYSYRLYMERIRKDMEHITQLNELNQAVILSLSTAIEAKDDCTSSHINRVQQYGLALARAAGLDGPDTQAVLTGALVHDIGKLGVPDHILRKPGKLTPEEYERMQAHVTIGAEILAPIPFPFPVVDAVLTHHERWDGLGYPNGLKGDQIPVGGRVLAVVDAFDALTSSRPYRRAIPYEEALQFLHEGAGKQFDPRLVEVFTQVAPQVRAQIEQVEAVVQARAAQEFPKVEAPSALAQISQSAAEMAAVCDVAHALAGEASEAQALRLVVNRTLGVLPADTAVLYLRGSEGTELTAASVEGKYQDRLEGMVIRVGEGVAGLVAETQQPLVNVAAAPDVARRFRADENQELSSVTAVPLVHGPEQLGVLAVYTQAYGVLTRQHLHVLNVLAEHAAMTIQNLRRMKLNQEMAFTDPLTGLANSRRFLRDLEQLLEPAPGAPAAPATPFSLVMLDLDGFKGVNDTLGHLRGDDLLRRIGSTLRQLVRPEDLVCRYAGDEFVLLLPGADARAAAEVAQRLRRTIDRMPKVDERVKIGASVGAATFPHDGEDVRNLIHAADQRMYEDKFRRKHRQGSALPVFPAAPGLQLHPGAAGV